MKYGAELMRLRILRQLLKLRREAGEKKWGLQDLGKPSGKF
jgi:hypothetical protein